MRCGLQNSVNFKSDSFFRFSFTQDPTITCSFPLQRIGWDEVHMHGQRARGKTQTCLAHALLPLLRLGAGLENRLVGLKRFAKELIVLLDVAGARGHVRGALDHIRDLGRAVAAESGFGRARASVENRGQDLRSMSLEIKTSGQCWITTSSGYGPIQRSLGNG